MGANKYVMCKKAAASTATARHTIRKMQAD